MIYNALMQIEKQVNAEIVLEVGIHWSDQDSNKLVYVSISAYQSNSSGLVFLISLSTPFLGKSETHIYQIYIIKSIKTHSISICV